MQRTNKHTTSHFHSITGIGNLDRTHMDKFQLFLIRMDGQLIRDQTSRRDMVRDV